MFVSLKRFETDTVTEPCPRRMLNNSAGTYVTSFLRTGAAPRAVGADMPIAVDDAI